MKLKLDENLGRRGADVFRMAGHDVTTVSEQGMNSAADPDLISACHSEGRCLVTLDLDFSNPLEFPPALYSGIAVLRVANPVRTAEILACCRTLVSALVADDVAGQLWTDEAGRVRRYQPLNPDA